MVDPGYIDADGVLATNPEAWVALASVVTTSAVSHVTFASNYSSGGAGSGYSLHPDRVVESVGFNVHSSGRQFRNCL